MLKYPGTFVPASSSNDQALSSAPLDFERLVEAHYEGLYRFAMSMTRTQEAAEDLVQETFLTWAEKGHQLREGSKAKSWLYTTLHRHFLATKRRDSLHPFVEISDTEEEMTTVEPDHVTRLDAAELVALLSEVDEQYRGAVALFYIEDYSYEEIASVLEVPLGTVKSRIARGIGQLKALVLQQAKQAARTRGEAS